MLNITEKITLSFASFVIIILIAMVASVITTIMITRYAEQPTKIQIVKEASASGTINVYVVPDRNEAEGEITVNVV